MNIFFIAYVTFINALVQHVQAMHWCVLARALSCWKAQARLLIGQEQAAGLQRHCVICRASPFQPQPGPNRSDPPAQANTSLSSGKQRWFPAGNFQERWEPGRAPPARRLGGWWAGCQGQPGPSVWQLLRDSTWIEREPAEATGLRDAMAHTRYTNSWHPFSELPTGSLVWWELVLIGEAFLGAAATLPILPSPAS